MLRARRRRNALDQLEPNYVITSIYYRYSRILQTYCNRRTLKNCTLLIQNTQIHLNLRQKNGRVSNVLQFLCSHHLPRHSCQLVGISSSEHDQE